MQQSALEEIRVWAGAELEMRESHRPLTSPELVALAQSEFIDIGAHTVTHPMLSAHSREKQKMEIEEGKKFLEGVLGKPVSSFAYPFGWPAAYTGETVALVRDAGFSCACSTVADTAWRGSDMCQLPRFMVMDWDGQEFERQLVKWLT